VSGGRAGEDPIFAILCFLQFLGSFGKNDVFPGPVPAFQPEVIQLSKSEQKPVACHHEA
jgi:hypothetical protein